MNCSHEIRLVFDPESTSANRKCHIVKVVGALTQSRQLFFAFAIFSHPIRFDRIFMCMCKWSNLLGFAGAPRRTCFIFTSVFARRSICFALEQFRVHCRIHNAICYSLVSLALAKWIDLQTRENKLHLQKRVHENPNVKMNK